MRFFWIFIIVFALAVAGMVWWFVDINQESADFNGESDSEGNQSEQKYGNESAVEQGEMWTNAQYQFSLQYPQKGWQAVSDTSASLSPKFTIFSEPTPEDESPPFDHFANATHVSVYPRGIPTEGVVGTTRDIAFEVPFALSSESTTYVLEEGMPYATYLVPQNPPASWNDSGFVWVRARIENFSSVCLRNGEEIDMEACDILGGDDSVVHRGNVDENVWKQAVEIARSIDFSKKQGSGGEGKTGPITLENVENNALIESPLTIRGQAPGTWYFEGVFPVVLTDWDGNIIAEANAQAQDDWMTEEDVEFRARLTFDNPTEAEGAPDETSRGTLIFQRANPSGLPENSKATESTVRFAP